MTNPKIGILCDRFDQGAINTNLWTNPSGSSVATLSTENIPTTLSLVPSYGSLSIPVDVAIPVVYCTGNSGGTSGIQSVFQYDLTDSGLSVEISSFTPNNYQAYFSIGPDSGDLVQWYIDNGGNLDAGTPAGYTRVANAPNFSVYRYFRIYENSGTVFWDYSSDGINWTNVLSAADPFDLTAVYVSLNMGGGSGAGPGHVSWANVNYVLLSKFLAAPYGLVPASLES